MSTRLVFPWWVLDYQPLSHQAGSAALLLLLAGF
jgi:hypothetical protein